MTRTIALFPLTGALLGAFLGGLGLLLDRALPPGPTAALILVAGTVASGGLHLDGLLDTADTLGGHTPEERLAIMRDSRVGAFGVVAGVLTILAQFACLSDLSGFSRFVALVLAYTISRWTLLLALGLFPAARPEGLGAAFHAAASRGAVLFGMIGAAVVVLLCGLLGIVALVASTLVLAAGGLLLTRRLGGLTGDACGALAVVTETVVLFVAVALTLR
jgi:adenosylcobinamide-GDP ribazoletransferase